MTLRRAVRPWRLFALAATLLTMSALLPWNKVFGLPTSGGYAVGFFTDTNLWSPLRWDGLSPSVGLRVLTVAAAWSLVLLVRVRARTGALVAVPLAIGVAFGLGAGNPAPWPWGGASTGLRIAPSTGYWFAASSLIVVLVGVAAAMMPTAPSEDQPQN
jgi:hypothetical protein